MFLGKRRSKSGFKQWVSGDVIKQIISILLLERFLHYPSPDEHCSFHLDMETLKVTGVKVLAHDENSFPLQKVPSEARSPQHRFVSSGWSSVTAEDGSFTSPRLI